MAQQRVFCACPNLSSRVSGQVTAPFLLPACKCSGVYFVASDQDDAEGW